MTNLLYFSDYIKQVAKKIRFFLIVGGRFFVILVRWRKGIRLLHLDYARKYQFDNSYLIIRYRFRNALWYNFKKIKKTTEKEIIVLNMSNLSENPIELIVYGFFRNKSFQISITTEHTLNSKSFKTTINGVNGIRIHSKPIRMTNKIPTYILPKFKLNHPGIKIKQPSFNQTDFI